MASVGSSREIIELIFCGTKHMHSGVDKFSHACCCCVRGSTDLVKSSIA